MQNDEPSNIAESVIFTTPHAYCQGCKWPRGSKNWAKFDEKSSQKVMSKQTLPKDHCFRSRDRLGEDFWGSWWIFFWKFWQKMTIDVGGNFNSAKNSAVISILKSAVKLSIKSAFDFVTFLPKFCRNIRCKLRGKIHQQFCQIKNELFPPTYVPLPV